MAATDPDTPVCGQTANRVPVLERKHLARVTPLCSPLAATIRSSNESARRRPGYGWPLHSAQLSSGTLCFDQLSKRDIDTMPRLVAGLVRRSNLNGSPGWAHGACDPVPARLRCLRQARPAVLAAEEPDQTAGRAATQPRTTTADVV
jgi:hypothetical protein